MQSKPLILWRARQESNLYQELRKLSFYPLNYGRKEAVLYLSFCFLRRCGMRNVLPSLFLPHMRYIIGCLHAGWVLLCDHSLRSS